MFTVSALVFDHNIYMMWPQKCTILTEYDECMLSCYNSFFIGSKFGDQPERLK